MIFVALHIFFMYICHIGNPIREYTIYIYIMQIQTIEKHPSVSDQMRAMTVGESVNIELRGNMYVLIHTTRRRLEKANVGKWSIAYDKMAQTMSMTRIE